METMHNHPPRCCCISEDAGATENSYRMDRCPMCVEHGDLAQLGAECPHCHQLNGRPHTEYCCTVQTHPNCQHAAAGFDGTRRTVRTPGYDGPEGTEWDRGRAIVDTGTMFVDVPVAAEGDRIRIEGHPTASGDYTVTHADPTGLELEVTPWVDDGCRCPTAVHVAGCPTLPHAFRDATDDDGHPMPDTCARCGKPELSPVHRGRGPIGGPS